MKILYIIPYVPYPLNSGGNQAFFNMVDAARQQHDISLLLYIHTKNQKRAADDLQQVWNDVKFYCYNEEEHKTEESEQATEPVVMPKLYELQCRFFDYIKHSMERKIARRMRRYEKQTNWLEKFNLGNFVREKSVLFANYTDLNDGFLQYVSDIARSGFDLIQVEFYEYLPLISVLPAEVQKVFVHHELRYIRNQNEMSLFNKIRPTDKMRFENLKDMEIAMLSRYDHVIVLTETDKKLLAELMPQQHIYVSPALTSAGKNKAYRPFVPAAANLTFVGGGDHFPNADGVLWLCCEVVPELRKLGALPNIHIVGKWDKTMSGIAQYLCPEIHFTGFVDDLGEFLNGKVSVVPIRIGSGMRMKILDTISASAPMVTTSKGCEGLPVQHGQDCLIADTPAEFAQSIHRLLKDTALQQKLASSAIHKLDSLMDAETLLQKRMDFYKSLS